MENTSHSQKYTSLPQKRMGAGCLFFDKRGRVLLVKPSYKPVWEIPGGVVELNESPKRCCQREVLEEIGLDREIGRLLVVDYNEATAVKTESLMFVFDGGILTDTEIADIELQEEELIAFDFFTIDSLPAKLTETLRQRILAAWERADIGGDAYLEEGISNQ